MQVTDMWNLIKHHFPSSHRLVKSTITEFVDEMAFHLLANQLDDGGPRRRAFYRALADITNQEEGGQQEPSGCHTLARSRRSLETRDVPK